LKKNKSDLIQAIQKEMTVLTTRKVPEYCAKLRLLKKKDFKNFLRMQDALTKERQCYIGFGY
jgi:hypothetical protein